MEKNKFKALENHPLFSKCFFIYFPENSQKLKNIFNSLFYFGSIWNFRGIYARSTELISLCILAYTTVFRQFDHHLKDKHTVTQG